MQQKVPNELELVPEEYSVMIGSYPCNISFHNDQLFHCTINGQLSSSESELPVTRQIYFCMPVLCLALKCCSSRRDEAMFFYPKRNRNMEQWHFLLHYTGSQRRSLWKRRLLRVNKPLNSKGDEGMLKGGNPMSLFPPQSCV
ncbi:hypothetical protein AMECASPLE_029189 [Ameca splendens]|uniref:Uncharacterized protein n=1 Tax=Ameca splendens TaxID=208324 RepID=A0ABV0Y5L8_9TELE